jgi:hypothetical protein
MDIMSEENVDPQEPGKITGYRQVAQADIDLANEIKEVERVVGDLVKKVRDHNEERDNFDQWLTSDEFLDDGVKSLRTGFMYVVRSVFLPDTNL